MILIGLGSNLPSSVGDSAETIHHALAVFAIEKIPVLHCSRLWKTAPVPPSDQPWFVNAVASIETRLSPEALLKRLHDIEHQFDRTRHEINAARTLDLDILDYNGVIQEERPVLPHPRLTRRAFVLLPLRDIAPDWLHPMTKASLDVMIEALPADQEAEPFLD